MSEVCEGFDLDPGKHHGLKGFFEKRVLSWSCCNGVLTGHA